MKISATFYNDAGELMAPRPLDVTLSSVAPGGIPSTEAGFYWRFKFEGRTQAELDEKRRRFFDSMGRIPGYSTLVLRPYTVSMGGFFRTGLDIIYVIEAAQDIAMAADRARTARAPRSTAVATSR
ncbi:MAG: hypothetical protein ABWX92_12005 [Mycetocola sp.]